MISNIASTAAILHSTLDADADEVEEMMQWERNRTLVQEMMDSWVLSVEHEKKSFYSQKAPSIGFGFCVSYSFR